MNTRILGIQNIIFGLLFVCVFFGLQVRAENIASADIEVNVTPQNPEPYQDVTVDVASFATDMNTAYIEWFDAGKIVLSGTGRTAYTTKTGGPDSPTNITVSVTPAGGGGKVTKKITIYSSDIEVFWEAVDGYTPPFYRGKSFSSSEGRVKVVAIPNTTTGKGKTGNISYLWRENDVAVPTAGGYKKDSFIFQNDAINSNDSISVNASSTDGLYNASKTISIPVVKPQIIFYKKSPNTGTEYSQAFFNESSLTDEVATIVAEPYFLNIRGVRSSVYNYDWEINGESVTTPSRPRELTIKPESNGGYATIRLTIEGIDSLFQKITNTLKINL